MDVLQLQLLVVQHAQSQAVQAGDGGSLSGGEENTGNGGDAKGKGDRKSSFLIQLWRQNRIGSSCKPIPDVENKNYEKCAIYIDKLIKNKQ